MRKLNNKSSRAVDRCGFTLLELLVVISIIAALMSLILPAIQNARRAARQVQCLNNLRNVSVAMLGYESAKRRFPAAGYWAGIPGSRYPSHNWVVELLPHLDRQDLFDRWDYSVPYHAAPNSNYNQTQVQVLVCPEDDSLMDGGDLSYAVNGGVGYTTFLSGVHDVPVNSFGTAIDLNGNGITAVADDNLDGNLNDRAILKTMGLFFMENFGENAGVVRHYSMNGIRDGYSNTLMILENVRTGRQSSGSVEETWATPFAHKTAVFFDPAVCESNKCGPETVDYARANGGSNGINSGLKKAEGRSPFANSQHSGFVNCAYADGSVKPLGETVSGSVYAALMSPTSNILNNTHLQQVIPSGEAF